MYNSGSGGFMNKYVFTSDYLNCDRGNKISISADGIKFSGRTYPELAPTREILTQFNNNKGCIPIEDNINLFVENYYLEVLSKLDPNTVLKDLGNDPVLITFNNGEEYARFLSSFWLELFTGVMTSEIKYDIENNRTYVNNRPIFLKKLLETVIKRNYSMHGFNCIRAAYLDNLANIIEYDEAMYGSYSCHEPITEEPLMKISELRNKVRDLEDEYNLKERLKMSR